MNSAWIGLLGAVCFASCSSVGILSRNPASAGVLQTQFHTFDYGGDSLTVRIGTQNPAGAPVGDVLYIHGFADRLDNHGPLFDAWTHAGLRVISFDLPSHGEDSGTYNDLNKFSFQDLADLAGDVEKVVVSADPGSDPKRPLLIAGWSTGGLIAVRLLQEKWTSAFTRPIAGAILFAPGVSVRKFPWTFGNRLGEVTQATLTHDPHPPHHGAIEPVSPFWSSLIFGFSPRLIRNSFRSREPTYPEKLPTLVFVAGDEEDKYAVTDTVKGWIGEQDLPRKLKGEAAMTSIQCPHAMHELDNELPEYGGEEVRAAAARFAEQVATGGNASDPAFRASIGRVCQAIVVPTDY